MAQSEASWFATYRTGFFVTKQAEGISPETVADYHRSFGYFAEWLGDRAEPTVQELRAFFAWLRERPNGLAPKRKLSAKTVQNAYVALKSFYRWYAAETGKPNPMATLPIPSVPPPAIDPLSQAEVQAILRACDRARPVQRPGQRAFSPRRPTATRDRALVLFLLDSGLRASELCALRLADLELESGKVFVRCGKGRRQRIVYVGRAARRALWRYLAQRRTRPEDPVFVVEDDRPFNRNRLHHLIDAIGKRAGVASLHPHRLRHTFATEFLRNGGNLLELQRLLGHSSIEMVRRYAQVAEADLARAHETGSPADRWRL